MHQNEFAVKFQSNDLYNTYAITSGVYPQGTVFNIGQTIYVTPMVYVSSTLSLSNYSSWQGLHLIPFQGVWTDSMADRDIYKIVITDTSMLNALQIAINARTIMAAPTQGVLESVWRDIILDAQGSTQCEGIRYKSQYPVVFVSQPPQTGSNISTYMNMAHPFGTCLNPLELNNPNGCGFATTWAQMGGWEPNMGSGMPWTACLSADMLNWLSSGTYTIPGVTMSSATKSALPIMPEFYTPSEAVSILNNRGHSADPLYMATTLSPNSSDWHFPSFLNPAVFENPTSLTTASGADIVNLAPTYLNAETAKAIAPSFASGAFVLSKKPYVICNTFWGMSLLQSNVSEYALPAKTLGIDNTVSAWTTFINSVATDLQNDIYQYWTSTTTMPTGPAPAKTTKTAKSSSTTTATD